MPGEQERKSQLPDDLKMRIHQMIGDMRLVRDALSRETTEACEACGLEQFCGCEPHDRLLGILDRWLEE